MNYFNPDLGTSCNITMMNEDTFYIKNTIKFILNDTLFSIKRNFSGKVILTSIGVTGNMWSINTIGNLSTDVNFFKNETGYKINKLEVRNFIFSHITPDPDSILYMTKLDAAIVSSQVDINFKNFSINSQANVSLHTEQYINANYYGYTFNCKNLSLS